MVAKRYLIIILAALVMNLETVAANAQEKPASAQQKAVRHERSMSADFFTTPVGIQQRGQEFDERERQLERREVVVNAEGAMAQRCFAAAKATERNQQKLYLATQALLAKVEKSQAALERAPWQDLPTVQVPAPRTFIYYDPSKYPQRNNLGQLY